MRWLLPFVLLYLLGCKPQTPETDQTVHPLDSWSDEIMYFVLTDRFADGDSTNNDLGWNEYNPQLPHAYHGGDLLGLSNQIGYLQSLGITSVWITPPVRNAVWSRDTSVTGYHGYWASHFTQVDPHLGNLNDYRHLAAVLKQNKMRLVQDVVTNHVADYFTYEGEYDPEQPWVHFRKYGQPSQAPFHMNDARNAKHRKAAIYHFTPAIQNYQDSLQKLRWQMSDLDDLNTENPRVIDALKKSFRFWMDSVGIDGIRFDTPLYVDHPFWHQFLHDSTAQNRGLKPHAKAIGRPHFYTFGETWVHSAAQEETGELHAKKYLGTAEKPEMDGILHFPMQQSMQAVFAGGAPTNELQYRLQKELTHFPEPWQRLHFIDNHDMPRFASAASTEATRQALAFILTIPGIPVIYYGTEQGLTETRGNLFEKRDTSSSDFKFLQALIALRKSSPCFSRGQLEVLAVDSGGAGIFCYRLKHNNTEKWVLFNTADYPVLHGHLNLGNTQSGQVKTLLQQGEINCSAVSAGRLGLVEMGAKAFVVFEIQAGTGKKAKVDMPFTAPILPDTIEAGTLKLTGKIARADSLKAFLNGNRLLATKAVMVNSQFEMLLPLQNVPKQMVKIWWVAYEEGRAHGLGSQQLCVALPEVALKQKTDKIGDDSGPKGTYRYPTAFGTLKSLDFKKASLFAQGHKLRLVIDFENEFSTAWNPPLGFDHLQLTLLLHWNDVAGGKRFEQANYQLPSGKKASRIIQINGWQVQTFALDDQNRTQALSSGPNMRLLGKKSMEIVIGPDMLGFPTALNQVELVLLSWDSAGEGGFRPLEKQAGAYSFGGGRPTDPLWMDELLLSWKAP
ncbi:MAG: hypothetical protein C0424_06870 [Sphingobacteriaceae bacterium]|nr:hypothetical protein [Sphingobacteriaceae bacterium]